jgi:hypothetical protein
VSITTLAPALQVASAWVTGDDAAAKGARNKQFRIRTVCYVGEDGEWIDTQPDTPHKILQRLRSRRHGFLHVLHQTVQVLPDVNSLQNLGVWEPGEVVLLKRPESDEELVWQRDLGGRHDRKAKAARDDLLVA